MTIAGITDSTAETQGKRPLDVGTRHYSVRRAAPQEERDTVVDDGSQQDTKKVTASEAVPTSGPDNGASLIASTLDTGTTPAQAAAPKRSSAAAPLQSLAPSYQPEQHETYLNRLEEAVREPRNLNIALTGRYGAGKSSVLDQFQDNHRKVTLRLAISTLAPGEENTSTTNRIQKEIVKQLVYGASQQVGKNSRFSHISVLTKPVALLQSLLAVGVIGGLLYLFGWLPDIKWTGTDETTWVRAAAWVGTTALATLAVTVARLVTHGKLRVSNVTAGAAAVTLSEQPQTFFDKYIDEIVHYFEQESKDIVVFEDLDRFEDPHIFEALRELNILLNDVPKRRAQRRGSVPGRIVRRALGLFPGDVPSFLTKKLPLEWATRLLGIGKPLRFVYAVKDSLFERIDLDTVKATAAPRANGTWSSADGEPSVDAAAAETQRANRTKFFDVVIPLVPFISHRNSRELLLDLLNEAGITGIDRQLVHIVSQHSTDMRLVRNMCNEYLVFAERLLESDKIAPDLNESRLFALVAYKNFHLSDFENISRRVSDLDLLYASHQHFVRESIARKEQHKRDLQSAPDRERAREQLVRLLAARLLRYANAELRAHWNYNLRFLQFKVGPRTYMTEQLNDHEFWADLVQTGTLTMLGRQNETSNGRVMATWERDDIKEVLPEALNADRWAELDASGTELDLKSLDHDISVLRRVGFAELAAMDHFTLVVSSKDAEPVKKTFAALVDETLKSDLARELVRHGHIDRNFSLYAAQFYGHFNGADVATFMVQHVQPKTMNIDYNLKRDNAVRNLLTEAESAGEDFTRTIAAYNIDVVNHLLATDHPGADHVVRNLITHFDDNARDFLASYFTSDTAEREKLAARLAEHRWHQVFTYLVSDDGVPAKARPGLVSAALCAFDPQATYDLSDNVAQFITDHYHHMSAFTEPQPQPCPTLGPESVAERVDVVLERTGILISKLDKLEHRLLGLIVEASRYQLNAANLRSALGITGSVSLDHVQHNQTVYEYCLAQPAAYIGAVDADDDTEHTVDSQQTLVNVLNDIAEKWHEESTNHVDGDLAELLQRASTDARLNSVREVPTSTWVAVAASDLLRTSLTNVEMYRAEIGSIDLYLARALEASGAIHVDEPGDTIDEDGNEYDREAAAVAIINATTFSSPETRVALVESLHPGTELAATQLPAETNNLFALLLENDRVADDEASFAHFSSGGWAAIGPAIKASANIGEFINPELVDGMVAQLLNDPDCASKIGRIIVENIETYLPNDDDMAGLNAAAEHADAWHIPLAPDTVVRVAHTGTVVGTPLDGPERTLRLLCAARPAPTSDQIVEVFSHLGDPYDQIRQTGAKFQLPRDPLHEQLLPILKADGLISWSTTRKGPRKYVVTVR